jgi:hypothetical protein
LNEILIHWGRPPVAIERNYCGAQVVDNLRNTYGYESIISWGAKTVDKSLNQRIGVISHTNTKYRGIMNMRYWLNELRVVKVADIKTLLELRDFVRKPNQTWSGRTANTLDDRVMALVWALIALDNDICPIYFDVVKMDDNLRPKVLKSLDYGVTRIVNPIGLYVNEVENPGLQPLPVAFSDPNAVIDENYDNDDLQFLHSEGWRFPNDINKM